MVVYFWFFCFLFPKFQGVIINICGPRLYLSMISREKKGSEHMRDERVLDSKVGVPTLESY